MLLVSGSKAMTEDHRVVGDARAKISAKKLSSKKIAAADEKAAVEIAMKF